MRRFKQFPKGHLALVAGVSAAVFLGLALIPADNASAYRIDSLFLNPPPKAGGEDVERIALTLDIPEPPRTTHLFEEDNFEPEADWHAEKVRRGDNMSKIFSRLRLSSVELDTVMKLGPDTSVLKALQPGDVVEVSRDDEGKLEALRYAVSSSATLVVTRTGEEFIAEQETRPVETRMGFGCGVIESSLFGAGLQAGLADAQIMKLADIFEYDIDFHQEIQNGDSFCVVFEERYVNGEKVENGPILAAEFINQGLRYSAVRYTDQAGDTSYYAGNGLALKKAFLRAPLKFTRISSDFNPRRKHPILNKIRAHKGTDYSAPQGTPIYAPSNGVVKFVGKQNGFGNLLILQHGQRYSTKYGHVSRFAKGLRNGQKVKQGDVVAYVGATGLATAPHLHYEFLVDGVHKNSRTVELPKAEPIPNRERSRFFASTKPLVAQLELRRKFVLAQNGQAAGSIMPRSE
ncbi:MAG: peptidoglycan DD-metalloendopeptidase family protein [Gammaproteobacteria bacterium]|nr:peptidoglycan DD-metalloendopeptidase family protein [Gammaproteobacteria bacterium]